MNWSSISPAPTATIPFTEPTTIWHSHTALDRTQITPYPSIDQLVAQQFESTSTLSCYVPNVVVLSIHTDVTISDYRSIYHDQDIFSFNPNYHATRDGSLLSSALSKDLKQGAQSLLMFGAYAIFFFSNSIAAVGFIPRTTAKSKAIFYTLLASQISAFLPWLLLIVSVFSPVLNCQAVLRAATFFLNTAVSLALSGVFGYKAYRCLFNSIFVLTGLSCFQVVRSSMLIVELIKLRATRGLNGICQYKDGSNSRLVPTMIIITFLEAVFIASCFLYAVLRSSHLLAAQGRLSFQESLKEPAPARDSERQDQESLPSRRSRGMEPTRLIITTPTVVPAGLPPDAFNKGAAPLIPPGAISTRAPPFKAYRIRETLETWIKSFLGSPVVEVVTGSSIRQALFKPRLVLFREVIRDELCYTTVMAAATVVSATFATIGTFKWQGVFNVHEWGSLHLAVLSLLAVHSMRRVVRRNEQEKILQDPRFSDPMRRAARVGSRFDSLSFNSRITFHTTTRAPRSTNSNPIDLPGRSTLKRWTPRRGSVASQDSSRAMLNPSGTRPPSWDSTEFLPARRLSYSSISPRSSQSIEYLVPPLNTNSQDVPTSPHWSPIITPAAVYT